MAVTSLIKNGPFGDFIPLAIFPRALRYIMCAPIAGYLGELTAKIEEFDEKCLKQENAMANNLVVHELGKIKFVWVKFLYPDMSDGVYGNRVIFDRENSQIEVYADQAIVLESAKGAVLFYEVMEPEEGDELGFGVNESDNGSVQ